MGKLTAFAIIMATLAAGLGAFLGTGAVVPVFGLFADNRDAWIRLGGITGGISGAAVAVLWVWLLRRQVLRMPSASVLWAGIKYGVLCGWISSMVVDSIMIAASGHYDGLPFAVAGTFVFGGVGGLLLGLIGGLIARWTLPQTREGEMKAQASVVPMNGDSV